MIQNEKNPRVSLHLNKETINGAPTIQLWPRKLDAA